MQKFCVVEFEEFAQEFGMEIPRDRAILNCINAYNNFSLYFRSDIAGVQNEANVSLKRWNSEVKYKPQRNVQCKYDHVCYKHRCVINKIILYTKIKIKNRIIDHFMNETYKLYWLDDPFLTLSFVRVCDDNLEFLFEMIIYGANEIWNNNHHIPTIRSKKSISSRFKGYWYDPNLTSNKYNGWYSIYSLLFSRMVGCGYLRKNPFQYIEFRSDFHIVPMLHAIINVTTECGVKYLFKDMELYSYKYGIEHVPGFTKTATEKLQELWDHIPVFGCSLHSIRFCYNILPKETLLFFMIVRCVIRTNLEDCGWYDQCVVSSITRVMIV